MFALASLLPLILVAPVYIGDETTGVFVAVKPTQVIMTLPSAPEPPVLVPVLVL